MFRGFISEAKKKYIVNLKTRQCNVTTVTMPFRPLGVPTGATFRGYSTLGASGLQGQFLNVASWNFTEGPNRYYGTVSTPDCFPVEYNYYSPPASFVTSTISMEWIAQEDEKENQAVAGLCEAILSVAVFEFTFEQWEVVEVDIRAAEEMKKMEKEGVKNEKKKKAQNKVVKEKHNDEKKSKPNKETRHIKGHEKKEAQTIDVIEAKQNGMKKRKTKNEAEKNIDGKKEESMKIKKENTDKMDTTNDGKKNTISANIRAFFRIFSCNKRQEKDKAVV
ncbi:unnamed protein product [Mytilus coruscus]|uniref:Uncharacterized protein n=1 Tax=Mytilus coruscus TaxID=42192 RepID=A0A6J8CFC4_MYTCO|nr:unnamed protein product [Mytilus coruscus]